MFNLEPKLHIVVEGLLFGFLDVRCLQRYCFIAVFLGDLHAAIPIAVLDVLAAEDYEAGFELLFVEHEDHGGGFLLCRSCVVRAGLTP